MSFSLVNEYRAENMKQYTHNSLRLIFAVLLGLALNYPLLCFSNEPGEEKLTRLEKATALYKSRDYAAAFPLYLENAESGDPVAQERVAAMLFLGEGVKEDHTTALYWYKEAAKNGNATAQYDLGFFYFYGGYDIVEQDVSTSLIYIRMAAKQGHVLAQNLLASVLVGFAGGVIVDVEEAVKWFKAAADQGHSDSMWDLALVYSKILNDQVKAVYWLHEGAKAGNPEAQLFYGALHCTGEIGEKNLSECAKWIGKAKDFGIDVSPYWETFELHKF